MRNGSSKHGGYLFCCCDVRQPKAFETSLSRAQRASYRARQGDHDDLVPASALAVSHRPRDTLSIRCKREKWGQVLFLGYSFSYRGTGCQSRKQHIDRQEIARSQSNHLFLVPARPPNTPRTERSTESIFQVRNESFPTQRKIPAGSQSNSVDRLFLQLTIQQPVQFDTETSNSLRLINESDSRPSIARAEE